MGQDLEGSRWSCPCLWALCPIPLCFAPRGSELCLCTGDSAWPVLTAWACGEGWLWRGEGLVLPQG